MSSVKVTFVKQQTSLPKNSTVIFGLTKKNQVLSLAKGSMPTGSISKIDLASFGASSTLESITKVPFEAGVGLLVGLGDQKLLPEDYRRIAGTCAANSKTAIEIIFDLPNIDAQAALALAQGALLGLYSFDAYKSKAEAKTKISKITVITDAKVSAAQLERIQIEAQAVLQTRDLINTPPNDLYPQTLVKNVQELVKGTKLTTKVWDEKALVKEGFGGIAAIGSGSARPPRLVRIEHKPKGAKRHLAIVGKGITFDSGGLSLKPAESMVGMKYDMTGAASVLQTIWGIAKLNLPIQVTAWLCLAENMPSGSAARPNDVIRIRNGKTVEVLNTDAEGRLVLADGLSAAAESKPDFIVDIATLTGAATVALGNRFAGLMGDESAVTAIQKVASETGELVWPMPMPTELRQLLNSDIADIANVKIGNRAGGMLIGAHFLREFVPSDIKWAHLDIAGPAENSATAYGYVPKGGTGFGVRTLIALAEAISRQK